MSAPAADDEVGVTSTVSSPNDGATTPSKPGRAKSGVGKGKQDREASDKEEAEGSSSSAGSESSDDGGSSDGGGVRGRFQPCCFFTLPPPCFLGGNRVFVRLLSGGRTGVVWVGLGIDG